MTWETTQQGKLWTHGVPTALIGKPQKTMDQARGGRSVLVKKGVYVIDHKPTGRFIVGTSDNVSKDVDKHLKALGTGKHPTKLMQDLYIKESYMQITEIPLANDKGIKETLREIRDSNTAYYCLLDEVMKSGALTSRK